MFEALLNAGKTIIHWLVAVFVGMGSAIFGAVLGALPNDPGSAFFSLSTLRSVLAATNAWVPLDYAISLFVSFLTFAVAWSGIRYAMKLIPFWK